MYSFVTDNNECLSNNGGCEYSCHNTIGSYYCSCNTGYVINSDNHHCDGKIINNIISYIV